MSSAKSRSDRLAKALAQQLSLAARTRDEKILLRTMGLWDWVSSDHVETTDTAELAADAVRYLLAFELGAFRFVVPAVLAFMQEQDFHLPGRDSLLRLKTIVEEGCDEDALFDWFYSEYPEG